VVGADQDDELYDDQSTSTTTTTTTTKAPQRVRRKITRATFASAFFPTPNPIDFSTVFSGFSNLDDNPLVFSVVLSIFGVYLLLLFWSRREDRKDVAKVCSDCDFVEFKSITINYFIFIFNTNQQYKDNFPPWKNFKGTFEVKFYVKIKNFLEMFSLWLCFLKELLVH